MIAAVLLAVLAAEPVALRYMAPDGEAPSAPDTYQLNEWKKGDALFVVTDDSGKDISSKKQTTYALKDGVFVEQTAQSPRR